MVVSEHARDLVCWLPIKLTERLSMKISQLKLKIPYKNDSRLGEVIDRHFVTFGQVKISKYFSLIHLAQPTTLQPLSKSH